MALLRCLLLAVFAVAYAAAPASANHWNVDADYRFNDNRDATAAGYPTLSDVGTGNAFATETVSGSPNRVLTFPAGNGLHLRTQQFDGTDAYHSPYSYTVAVSFRITDTSGYRRILNFQDHTEAIDEGLFLRDGKVNYYVSGNNEDPTSPFVVLPNVYTTVVFVRSLSPGDPNALVQVWVNGEKAIQITEPATGPSMLTSDGIRFFKDNTAGGDANEESAGAVARIHFFDAALDPDYEIPPLFGSEPAIPNADGDARYDFEDNCPADANTDQADLDADTQGDACDSDDDGDGVPDASDNCPAGDACDGDDDADGVDDGSDKCPTTADAAQTDTDGDGQGDACDSDDDGDGVEDAVDRCPFVGDAAQSDTDGDGLGNACDADDDGDGSLDGLDSCPQVAGRAPNGCPGGSLRQTGKARTRRAGKRGIRVLTGVQAGCPLTPLPCVLKASVGRLGRLTSTVAPAKAKRVSVKLSKRGARRLRRAGRLRVKIKVTITGADGVPVTLSRRVRLRAPR
jgi:hypothetical protein